MLLAVVVLYLFDCADLQADPEALAAHPVCHYGDNGTGERACETPEAGFGCAVTPDTMDFVLDPTAACLNGSGAAVPALPPGAITYRGLRAYAVGRFRIDDQNWSDNDHSACVRVWKEGSTLKDQFVIPIKKGFDARVMIEIDAPYNLHVSPN